MSSGPQRLTALQELHLVRAIEDRALIDLVEDAVERLNDLGDRLERFVGRGATEDRGESDDSR